MDSCLSSRRTLNTLQKTLQYCTKYFTKISWERLLSVWVLLKLSSLKLVWGTCAFRRCLAQGGQTTVLLLFHVFLLKSASRPLDLAPYRRPIKSKLVCQPNAFSAFHLMNVKETGAGGHIHEVCVFRWEDYSRIYYYIQSWLIALYSNGSPGIFSSLKRKETIPLYYTLKSKHGTLIFLILAAPFQ